MGEPIDLLVIGGGVNGTAIARDAAGRGLSVMLCEMADLASATSSASTKLIHGGLRYLEYGDLKLVRESLIEREVMLRAAPHIVRPMRFVLPHHKRLRPAWILRLGLFLYDHLGGRRLLPPTETINLRADPRGAPLSPIYRRGFEYSDCWVDDARLVVLYAVDAAERGAVIRTRTAVRGAVRHAPGWTVEIETADGGREMVHARALVNAAGPWVSRMRERIAGTGPRQAALRLVKGSHIVVPKRFDGTHAYIFQTGDKRVIFAIPYERDFTLIGTTDLPYRGALDAVHITEAEIGYLCNAANAYFSDPVAPPDVVWSFAGVRPLYDDMQQNVSAVTRDYVLTLDSPPRQGPLLSVFGGKITTSRKLAEQAVDQILKACGRMIPAWTRDVALPGGDFADADFECFASDLGRAYPWLDTGILERLARAYGTRAGRILGEALSMADLGRHLGGGLYEAELRYLYDVEWAQTTEDILWRRTKLGLHVGEDAVAKIDRWLAEALKRRARAEPATDRK